MKRAYLWLKNTIWEVGDAILGLSFMALALSLPIGLGTGLSDVLDAHSKVTPTECAYQSIIDYIPSRVLVCELAKRRWGK